jgi:hypothetical protein
LCLRKKKVKSFAGGRLLDVDGDLSGRCVAVRTALLAAALPTQRELVVLLQRVAVVLLGRGHVTLTDLEPVRVRIALHLRQKGRGQFLLQQALPVHAVEPAVLLDLLRALRPQPLLRIFPQK